MRAGTLLQEYGGIGRTSNYLRHAIQATSRIRQPHKGIVKAFLGHLYSSIRFAPV